jgi:hypothetical protein
MSTDPVDPKPTLGSRLLDSLAPHLPLAQRIGLWVTVAAFLVGLLASIGVYLLPPGDPAIALALHPVLGLLGAAGGAATAVRGRQIDKRRGEILEDPLLTDGERQTAHREAERERRVAGTIFLLAPVALGYWSAYQLAGEEGGTLMTYLLGVSPMLGFVLGLLAANRALGPEETRY